MESDINYLYMDINDTIVVVYQDGILQFKNIDWDEIANAYEKGSPILGLISGRTKGGFYVKFGSLYGFLPESEMELRAVQNLDSNVGKTYEMKIIEFDPEQNKLILSRRAWLEEKRSEFFENVEVGQKVKGIVKNIKDFGVFVDLGVIDGLIRKTELSWKRINNTSEVISIGDDVEVMVIQIDREAEKIALSLKRMTQDPWEDVDNKYPIGSTVQGTINRIEEYGVFLQLEEGVVGLLHISEMQYSNDGRYSIDLLNVGDVVEVTVLKVSLESKHISFSMRQTHEHLLEQLLKSY